MKVPADRQFPILLASSVCILFIFCAVVSADEPPTADDINNLSGQAQRIYDDFLQQTFDLRISYEYYDRFINPQDKLILYQLAEKAANDLQQLADTQRNFKQQIEDYQGTDWETRYGSTGLWRKLARDLYETTLSKLQIDYYLALSAEPAHGDAILQDIIRQAENLDREYNNIDARLIKACALVRLARTDPNQKVAALQELEVFRIYSDVAHPVRAEIERIKLLSRATPELLDSLIKILEQNRSDRHLELILSVMLLQRKYEPDGFAGSTQTFPETRPILGHLILSDISRQDTEPANLNNLTITDAELAAYTTWTTKLSAYKESLLKLCDIDKFRTPLTLYAAGIAVIESDPDKTITLLIDASSLQHKQKSVLLDLEADAIAEQAAQLAYDRFGKDKIDCQLALSAFDNLARIASDKMTEQMQYLYGTLLNDCGRQNQAVEMLSQLAGSSQTIWQDRATLELLKFKLKSPTGPNEPNEILSPLRGFILGCTGSEEPKRRLRWEAMNIYCEQLLIKDSNDSAEQVLEILDIAEPTPGLQYEFFRAQALLQLGRLEESAQYMSQAIIPDSGSMSPVAYEIISAIVNRIEVWEQQAADFKQMLADCNTLAEFAYKSINDRQAALTLAEVSVFTDDLNRAENLLNPLADENDVYWLRCKARLLMTQGNFEKSAELWAKISELRRNDSPAQNRKSWSWWQAKYHELACVAKTPSINKPDLHHTIEVLENTYPVIPAPWAKKLDALKRQILH